MFGKLACDVRQFHHQNALFHACEGEFHFDGQFSHMSMPKKPLEFAHCEQRAKSSLVVEMCVRKCSGIVGHSFDSTTKMLFPMSVRVMFTFMISFLMRWTLSSNANAMNNTMNDTMSVPLPSPVKMRPSLIIDPHNGQAFAETEG